jgi:hypothetical protein
MTDKAISMQVSLIEAFEVLTNTIDVSTNQCPKLFKTWEISIRVQKMSALECGMTAQSRFCRALYTLFPPDKVCTKAVTLWKYPIFSWFFFEGFPLRIADERP